MYTRLKLPDYIPKESGACETNIGVCLSCPKMRRRNELCDPTTRMLKVSFGEILAWTKKKRSLRNEKLRANRASETEEQRKE